MSEPTDGEETEAGDEHEAKPRMLVWLAYAEATRLPIFVGVAVPTSSGRRMIRELDDAVADVVGRLGSRIAPPKRKRRQ